MLEYARREVELAKKFEAGEVGDGGFDYGGACYDSALKAFESLTKDGHSGMSISLTKHILNRLIDGKPLTPIIDKGDVWNEVSYDKDKGCTIYQSKRMSSLFKNVYDDGIIKYNDINAYLCIDIHTGATYYSNLVGNVVDEMYPIEMPYMPLDQPIRIFCEDFLTDGKNGDYDTVGILYLNAPSGEDIMINRYFKEDEHGKWVEIGLEEYDSRARQAELLEPTKMTQQGY